MNILIDNKKNVIYEIETLSDLKPKYFYHFTKRIFDIVFALIGLIIWGIPMILIAIAIKFDSKGPVIFKQERLGKNGNPFILYKFRSMRMDSEKNGAQWAKNNDSRVTKIGRFLRRTRMDELPQLLNILLGQMSFVGPRPERACFYEEFETYIKGFSQRIKVVPGLTGFAQVNGGYDLLPHEKIAYDMYYIKKRSFLLDIKCILRTFVIVLSHEGAK